MNQDFPAVVECTSNTITTNTVAVIRHALLVNGVCDLRTVYFTVIRVPSVRVLHCSSYSLMLFFFHDIQCIMRKVLCNNICRPSCRVQT